MSTIFDIQALPLITSAVAALLEMGFEALTFQPLQLSTLRIEIVNQKMLLKTPHSEAFQGGVILETQKILDPEIGGPLEVTWGCADGNWVFSATVAGCSAKGTSKNPQAVHGIIQDAIRLAVSAHRLN